MLDIGFPIFDMHRANVIANVFPHFGVFLRKVKAANKFHLHELEVLHACLHKLVTRSTEHTAMLMLGKGTTSALAESTQDGRNFSTAIRTHNHRTQTDILMMDSRTMHYKRTKLLRNLLYSIVHVPFRIT